MIERRMPALGAWKVDVTNTDEGVVIEITPAPDHPTMELIINTLLPECIGGMTVFVGVRRRDWGWHHLELQLTTSGTETFQQRCELALCRSYFSLSVEERNKSLIWETVLANPGVLTTAAGRALLKSRDSPGLTQWLGQAADIMAEKQAQRQAYVPASLRVPVQEDEDMKRALALSLADYVARVDAAPQPPAPLSSPQLQTWIPLRAGLTRDVIDGCCPVCGTSYEKLHYAGVWQAVECSCLGFCSPCWRDLADRPTATLDRSHCLRCGKHDVHYELLLGDEKAEDPSRAPRVDLLQGPNLEEELDEEDAMDLDEFYTDTDWT